MIDFRILIRQKIIFNDREYDLDQVLFLLKAFQDNVSLRLAAENCGFSYRKAWNLLKELEELLGGTLVSMQRGRGSQLTALGTGLLQIAIKNERELQPLLLKVSGQTRQSLEQLLPGQIPNIIRIVASDSDILNRVREQTLHVPMSLAISGSLQALTAYSEGHCDVAGFHFAAGYGLGTRDEGFYRRLNSQEDGFVFLEQRQQGLVSRLDFPVSSLQQIIDEQLLFVNRQRGSGTRNLFDSLLREQGISYKDIRGYYHEEHTHLAVATMIATRQADVGLAVASVAGRMQLNFTPLAYENYFLVFKKALSECPSFKAVMRSIFGELELEILDIKQFKQMALAEIKLR